jgi:hypothetical protein
MNIEKYIPILAPMPPAVVIGLQLYDEVMAAANHPDWWWLATVAAFFGVVGTIGAEMIAYKYALQAWAEREKFAAFIAMMLGLFVSALIIWAVWRTDDSRPLVVAVLVAIAAYVVSAIRQYVEAKRARREEQTDRQVQLLNEQRKLTNAQARLAKAGHVVAPAVRAVREQDEHQTNRLNAELLARVRAYLEQHPGASIRETGAACGIKSSSTAKKYIDAAR